MKTVVDYINSQSKREIANIFKTPNNLNERINFSLKFIDQLGEKVLFETLQINNFKLKNINLKPKVENIDLQYLSATLYAYEHIENTKNFLQACDLIEKITQNPDASEIQKNRAYNTLGQLIEFNTIKMIREGRTGDKNIVHIIIDMAEYASSYYKKASTYCRAKYNLGALYENNFLQSANNMENATLYYEAADSLGLYDAKIKLADIYQNGRGVKQNQTKADDFIKQLELQEKDIKQHLKNIHEQRILNHRNSLFR